MSYTPADIMNYIYSRELTSAFLLSLARNTGNFTIAELTDKVIRETEQGYRLLSKAYHLDVPVDDDGVIAGKANDLYISAFLSRKDDARQLHFLVHRYPRALKSRFEEEILQEVVHYMIRRTVLTLRLDTPEKVLDYVGMAE